MALTRSISLTCVFLILAMLCLTGDECPVYKRETFGNYVIDRYQYCTGGCCGLVPHTFCCTPIVLVVGGSVTVGTGGIITVIIIRKYLR